MPSDTPEFRHQRIVHDDPNSLSARLKAEEATIRRLKADNERLRAQLTALHNQFREVYTQLSGGHLDPHKHKGHPGQEKAPFEGVIFVIDTDAYAGNFERQMVAYITGQLGECGVGDEYSRMFLDAYPELEKGMEDLVVSVPDEHGCWRPASIYRSPPGTKESYQSVALFLDKVPSNTLLDLMMARAKAFVPIYAEARPWNQSFGILGFRLVREQVKVIELALFSPNHVVVGP